MILFFLLLLLQPIAVSTLYNNDDDGAVSVGSQPQTPQTISWEHFAVLAQKDIPEVIVDGIAGADGLLGVLENATRYNVCPGGGVPLSEDFLNPAGIGSGGIGHVKCILPDTFANSSLGKITLGSMPNLEMVYEHAFRDFKGILIINGSYPNLKSIARNSFSPYSWPGSSTTNTTAKPIISITWIQTNAGKKFDIKRRERCFEGWDNSLVLFGATVHDCAEQCAENMECGAFEYSSTGFTLDTQECRGVSKVDLKTKYICTKSATSDVYVLSDTQYSPTTTTPTATLQCDASQLTNCKRCQNSTNWGGFAPYCTECMNGYTRYLDKYISICEPRGGSEDGNDDTATGSSYDDVSSYEDDTTSPDDDTAGASNQSLKWSISLRDLGGLNTVATTAFAFYKGALSIEGPLPRYKGCTRLLSIGVQNGTISPGLLLAAPNAVPLTRDLYAQSRGSPMHPVRMSWVTGTPPALVPANLVHVTCIPDNEFLAYPASASFMLDRTVLNDLSYIGANAFRNARNITFNGFFPKLGYIGYAAFQNASSYQYCGMEDVLACGPPAPDANNGVHLEASALSVVSQDAFRDFKGYFGLACGSQDSVPTDCDLSIIGEHAFSGVKEYAYPEQYITLNNVISIVRAKYLTCIGSDIFQKFGGVITMYGHVEQQAPADRPFCYTGQIESMAFDGIDRSHSAILISAKNCTLMFPAFDQQYCLPEVPTTPGIPVSTTTTTTATTTAATTTTATTLPTATTTSPEAKCKLIKNIMFLGNKDECTSLPAVSGPACNAACVASPSCNYFTYLSAQYSEKVQCTMMTTLRKTKIVKGALGGDCSGGTGPPHTLTTTAVHTKPGKTTPSQPATQPWPHRAGSSTPSTNPTGHTPARPTSNKMEWTVVCAVGISLGLLIGLGVVWQNRRKLMLKIKARQREKRRAKRRYTKVTGGERATKNDAFMSDRLQGWEARAPIELASLVEVDDEFVEA